MQNLMKIVCRSVTSDKCFFPFINLRYTSYQVYISLSYRITIHQKECNAAELVDSRTYELNDFKVEGERRKLDLPAQKNLLTNYFCILLYKYLALHFLLSFGAQGIINNDSLFIFWHVYDKQLFSYVPCIFRREGLNVSEHRSFLFFLFIA